MTVDRPLPDNDHTKALAEGANPIEGRLVAPIFFLDNQSRQQRF
jgi:hypothetical protein